jgi:hypothetical protein
VEAEPFEPSDVDRILAILMGVRADVRHVIRLLLEDDDGETEQMDT